MVEARGDRGKEVWPSLVAAVRGWAVVTLISVWAGMAGLGVRVGRRSA